MIHWSYEDVKHCRWCGMAYNAKKPIGKDGFHSAACKQAHYRAYKNYVTATDGPGRRIRQLPGRKK